MYYPGDINNSGIVRVEFADSVGQPTATIAYGANTVEAPVYEQGNTGRFWAIEVQEALAGVLTTNGTAIKLTVNGGNETVSGDYTYMPVFPLSSVTPENFSQLASKTETVVFTFNEDVTYDSIIVRSGSVETTLAGGSGKTVSVELKESYWASVTGADNNISVQLIGTKANGVGISNMSGAEGTIGASYTYKETVTTPTFVGVDQDPYWWLAQDLFGMDVEFDFNAPVDYTNASAVITFYDGETLLQEQTTNVSSSEMATGQNWRTGNYYLAVPIPDKTAELYEESLDMWLFTRMTVTLKGVDAIGLTDPYSISYDAEFPEEEVIRSAKKAKTAGVENLSTSMDEFVNIYSIEGKLLKSHVKAETINSLGRGLYIVNGKKVLVK